MGTRGAFGFHIDGVDKVTYNHFDSYPQGLGLSILDYIRRINTEEMVKAAKELQLVNQLDKPTPQQIALCKKAGIVNLMVGEQTEDDWYCLMREAQGNLDVYHNIHFMVDSSEFLSDSLFCEWAYVVNLDSGKLEVYQGFNKNPSALGRYASHGFSGGVPKDQYYGVALIVEIPLEKARTMTNNEFVEMVEERTSESNE